MRGAGSKEGLALYDVVMFRVVARTSLLTKPGNLFIVVTDKRCIMSAPKTAKIS